MAEEKGVKEQLLIEKKKQNALLKLDLFVLDNSIRESTVGQLRGHTVENKFKILDEVKSCGIKHIVVAAFSHSPRVDDQFVQELIAGRGKDSVSDHDLNFYAFTENANGVTADGKLDPAIPGALIKMKQFNVHNPIIEIDLADQRIDWETSFTVNDMCILVKQRIVWVKENLSQHSKVFVNLRDFPLAMEKHIQRVVETVKFLASLPLELQPFGLLYEEPTGKSSVTEMSAWTTCIRSVMDNHGWKSGHLLVHVHKKWGLAEAIQLECLKNGANGVWASLCEEGAATGHACSTITMMNLVRMGNRKVVKAYKCNHLRKAARNITKFTTGEEPHPKQLVYGDRAMDIVFDFQGIAGGKDDFDLGRFFNERRLVRITTLSTPEMVLQRMKDVFGDSPDFTLEMAKSMKQQMMQDLLEHRKEEYMSEVGLALLYDRSGGAMTAEMCDAIANIKIGSAHAEELIAQVRKIWDEWDLKEDEDKQGDECLEFDSFYNAFMVPYFGCYRCDDTRKGLQAIDMDNDGAVDWSEFLVYLKWALHQYPDIKDIDKLLSITFRKGLIPAMQDEVLKCKV